MGRTKANNKRLIKKVENDTGVSTCRLLFAIDDVQKEIVEMTSGTLIGEKGETLVQRLDNLVLAKKYLEIGHDYLKKALASYGYGE